jgi:PAS domain S-box-containing protein
LLLRYARKQLLAQKAVNHIAALLRSTVENLNQGVIVTDRHSRVLAWNQQFLMLRGLEESQMYVGMPTHQMQRAATSLRFMAHGEPKYDSRQIAFGFGDLSMPFDGEALCHDGRVLQVCGRPTPSGHYVATLSDITPLKLSEAAHRDQAIRLEAILNSIGDAIITLNESGSIESWNRGAQALFGYSSADILRRSVGLLALPATLLRDHQHWWGQLDPGQKYKPKQYQLVSKDGQLVDVDIVVSEVRIDSRRLLICLLRDIAERLEVERLKAGFVATVSHELRTPLTSILASLGLMAGAMAREMPPKALRLVDIARQNCERLIRLINDILDLEKAESGKLEFQLELHGLQALLQQAIDINRGFADNYAVRLELEINCVDASLLIDRDRLLQVLTNLISNAVKFSPSGSTIRVTAAIVGAVIKISIQDEGPGISSEFQQRIFQKFAQADASDSRSKGGTGLGLSISKTIMERLGGSIGFDARPSKGACFYITLPVSQAASPMSNRVTGHAAGHRVLVCDDDPDVRELIRAWLAESGAEAVPVQTIYEARAALASSRFDLALFDLHLADGSSVELLTQLRAEDSAPRIPVIVMTAASVSDAQLDQLHVLGVVDVLRKPMSRDELVGAVRRSTTTPAPNTVSPLYLGVGKCR